MRTKTLIRSLVLGIEVLMTIANAPQALRKQTIL
jgi:hypothetical protein